MKCQIKDNWILQKFFIYHCLQERGGRVKTFFLAEYLSVVEITSKSLMILRLPRVMMSNFSTEGFRGDAGNTSGGVALEQAQRG